MRRPVRRLVLLPGNVTHVHILAVIYRVYFGDMLTNIDTLTVTMNLGGVIIRAILKNA